MKLPPAPGQYSQANEQQTRNEQEKADRDNHKKGRHIDLGGSDFYVILTSPNGTRHSVTVSNAGALVVTPL